MLINSPTRIQTLPELGVAGRIPPLPMSLGGTDGGPVRPRGDRAAFHFEVGDNRESGSGSSHSMGRRPETHQHHTVPPVLGPGPLTFLCPLFSVPLLLFFTSFPELIVLPNGEEQRKTSVLFLITSFSSAVIPK